MNKQKTQREALDRARTSRATSNYMAIFTGFEEKGIPAESVIPRENVFTFAAWRALGRIVKKGEHGVKVTTWIPMEGKKGEEGSEATTDAKKAKPHCRPRTATVFHISQTKPMEPVPGCRVGFGSNECLLAP